MRKGETIALDLGWREVGALKVIQEALRRDEETERELSMRRFLETGTGDAYRRQPINRAAIIRYAIQLLLVHTTVERLRLSDGVPFGLYDWQPLEMVEKGSGSGVSQPVRGERKKTKRRGKA